MRHPLFVALSVGLLLAVAVACSDRELNTIDRKAALTSIGERVALPLYREVLSTAEALHASAQDFCASPDAEGLEALRAAWWEARAPWKRADTLAFGPYTEAPWRVGPKLDSWPARPGPIETLLAGDAPVDAAAVAAMGSFMKGYPVLEYLVHPLETEDAEVLAGLSEGETGARRCTYLVSVAAELEQQASVMLEAWSADGGAYAEKLANSDAEDGAFMTAVAAYSEVVNRMSFTAENIRELKIGKPRGRARGGRVDLSLLESRYSDRSFEDIYNNLEGLEAVYRGSLDPNDAEAVGPRQAILDRRPELDPRMFELIDAAKAATRAVPVPLSEALFSHPDEVEAVYQAVLDLHRFIAVELSQALSVTVAFNDTDGD